MMTHPSIPELTSNGRRLLMTKQWPDNFKLQSVCSSRFAQEQMWCHSTFSHPCFTGEAKCIWLLCVCVCLSSPNSHLHLTQLIFLLWLAGCTTSFHKPKWQTFTRRKVQDRTWESDNALTCSLQLTSQKCDFILSILNLWINNCLTMVLQPFSPISKLQ